MRRSSASGHLQAATVSAPQPLTVGRALASIMVAVVLSAGMGFGVAAAEPTGSLGGLGEPVGVGSLGSLSPTPFASALVTAEQREKEALARQILAADVMRREIERTKARYAADPAAQMPAARATIDRAANSIAAAAAQYALVEDTDRPSLMWMVTAPHNFAGLKMPRSGFGIENPDNVYREGLLDGKSRYEIHGKWPDLRPTELHFEMRDSIPGLMDLTNEAGKIIGDLSSERIHTEPDGTFVVTIDSDPANGRPNHIQVPHDGTPFLIVRDLLNDWTTERPASLSITRVDGPPAGEAKNIEQLSHRAAEILSKFGPFWQSYFNQYVYTTEVNNLQPVRARPGGRGMSTNGWFNLSDDEAMVITADPASARSMGIQITDPWGVAYEYRSRTSSLNTTQSVPNPDGTYTYVISKKDPGVANWLDPDGHEAGLIAIRWQALSGAASPGDAVRSVQVVRLQDLRNTLPASTAWTSPIQRALHAPLRAADYDRRMR